MVMVLAWVLEGLLVVSTLALIASMVSDCKQRREWKAADKAWTARNGERS